MTYTQEKHQAWFNKMILPYQERFNKRMESIKNDPIKIDDYDYQHFLESEQATEIAFNNLQENNEI